MSPNNDGKMIRLIVPPMSGEQRQKMVARIKKSAEEAKVACRNIRRDANKHFDQAEKDKRLYAVLDGFAQSQGHLSLTDARYLNAMKLFIQGVTPLEYAAHRQRFLAEQGYAYTIVDADDLMRPLP